jgi:multidrug resistance protein MdtO
MNMPPAMSKGAWFFAFAQDLRPTPGRMPKALRIVLVCLITVVVIMTFRLPFSTLGLFFIFLANRMNPALSLRSSLYFLLGLVAAVAAEFGFVAVSGNDPVVRLLSVTLVIFVCGIFIHESSFPALGVVAGSLYTVLIAQWEFHTRPDDIVENSLWSIVTLSVGLAVSVAAEYVFASKDPSQQLLTEIRLRYTALNRMFLACVNAAPKDDLDDCVTQVGRLAAVGQVEMRRFYVSIANRGVLPAEFPSRMQEQIAMLARLVDLSAAFGAEYVAQPKPDLRERCEEIAAVCSTLELNPRAAIHYEAVPGKESGYLSRVERALSEIVDMSGSTAGAAHPDLTIIPDIHNPVITLEGLKNEAALRFALKLSCCGTFCYVFYHAVGWPGMYTCVVTVMIAGLDDTGASKQRLSLRLAGMVIGGIVFGLGSIVFLYPHMESIASFVLLVAVVSFVGAWFGSGRRFGFLGPQTAYAFFLVAVIGNRPTIDLLPAKDNLAGFAFAAVVMWVVFDQIASTPTTVLMRRLLITSLRLTADLLRLMNTPGDRGTKLVRGRILRYRMGKVTDQIRTENETVEYEFGPNHGAALDQANRIVNISFDANSLFWEELAILYGDSHQEEQTNPEMAHLRRRMSESLLSLAGQLDDRKSSVGGQLKTGGLSEGRDHTSGSPYARRAIAQYRKIERGIQDLLAQTPLASISPAPTSIREPLH